MKSFIFIWRAKLSSFFRHRILNLPILDSMNTLFLTRKYNLDFHTRRIKVTVLGSCRQDSIFKSFAVDNIRDGLTYPHYSKEIIQVLDLMRGKINYSELHPKCFRNQQLNESVLKTKSLKQSFTDSQIFVVEIASRISYKLDGSYFHHEAIDNPDRKVISIIERNKIVIETQSDSEIVSDMGKILEICNPRPVLFVSHLSTYEHGSRYELTKLVERTANELGAGFFNPAQILLNHPLEKVIVPEPVVSHFTDFGHEVLQGRFKLALLRTLNGGHNSFFKLTQVMNVTDSRNQKFGAHGLADCIYGAGAIY
jgi:hypothetical protein